MPLNSHLDILQCQVLSWTSTTGTELWHSSGHEGEDPKQPFHCHVNVEIYMVAEIAIHTHKSYMSIGQQEVEVWGMSQLIKSKTEAAFSP